MLQVFDSFLASGTWHVAHTNNDERFYRALAKVVRQPSFSPDAMGEYMREKNNVSDDDAFQAYDMAIKHRVAEAWAIRDFLRLGL